MGVFKVDWALDGPIPWSHPECALAGTVHLGGTLDEVAASERDARNGRVSERPFVLLSQPTIVDASRAPAGRHVAWTYCHVPHGSTADMQPAIERQIERFAPGFRDRVLARAVKTPADFERDNPNYVGGDIGAGVTDMFQFFTRPTWRTYSTPVRGLYLCSASTPPGVGVHGMCGYFAAQRALNEVLRD
jgi:phytoene dehydrogenase-like protein